jgi:7,8-dihydropterin-6-yl-methyl-4-(beta-D-ribofuranosyl)aminobenzene 5'-phosphate synthase
VLKSLFTLLGFAVIATAAPALDAPSTRVTILFDAFGDRPELRKDWGYSALIEHRGMRILFDTGNDADFFQQNVEALGVDLGSLDFVIISHRHGDHTDGLRHLLTVNPSVKIYVANDEYFGGPTPQGFFRRPVDSLPDRMRYFGGNVPELIPHGSPWKSANTERVAKTLEVAPGIRIVANVSHGSTFTETPEISLSIDTPEGQLVFVGCSHPGIETILESLGSKTHPVRCLVGGLHWLTLPDPEVQRLAKALSRDWNVRSIAPGHCTGEFGFAELQGVYGAQYLYAGLGSVIEF